MHRSRIRGLLLFEVCVAMTIMAIAIIWMLRGFSQTTLAVERARDQSAALRLLNEQVLYALVTGAVPLAGESGSAPDDPAWRWTVTAAPRMDPNSRLLDAQFTVQWTYRHHPYTLTATTWLPPSQ